MKTMMNDLISVNLEATELRGGKWAVRPEGQLGTCGFFPCPWTVQYITAKNEQQALSKAHHIYMVKK